MDVTDGSPELRTNAEASNGFWVGGLQLNQCSVDFVFNSSKAVSGVTLTLRLSTEFKDITLTPELWEIRVNSPMPYDHYTPEADENDDDGIAYDPIVLDGAVTDLTIQEKRPFTDHVISKKIDLKEGKNTINFVTDNTEPMAGTMYATAPLLDCITLSTFGDASLSWTPITSNLDDWM